MTLSTYALIKAGHLTAAVLFAGGMVFNNWALLSASKCESLHRQEALAAALQNDRLITKPALGAVWALGLWLAMTTGSFGSEWLTLKLILVVTLTALHGYQSGRMRRMATGTTMKGIYFSTTPCIFGAVAAITLLAALKPF
nr:CopD family protein [Pseudoxanthomonas sp.]